jgi:hypothetical protein
MQFTSFVFFSSEFKPVKLNNSVVLEVNAGENVPALANEASDFEALDGRLEEVKAIDGDGEGIAIELS